MTRQECDLRHVIGVEKMMWGSDYPHFEGTWPHTKEKLHATFAGVPEAEVRPIVGENAAKVYNFDVERLAPFVERAGPPVREL